MKLKLFFFVLVAGIGLLATSSCKQESKDKAPETEQAGQTEQPAAGQPQAQPNVQLPPDFTPVSGPPSSAPQNAKGVWHFTCAKGCAGGAGAAGPCSKCGEALVHNQAYHEN